MKAIILAAGEGSRLRPYTNDVPKCMVQFKGKPIIDYILDTFDEVKISDIVVVNGYKREVLEEYLTNRIVKFIPNAKYASTNMVYTFFCAESEFNDDLIISYSDIIYKSDVLRALVKSTADFSVVVDKKWRKLWEKRMEDPLKDAETMKIDINENIVELGKKPISYKDIEGQYIGLIKISKHVLNKLTRFYYSLDKNAIYDGKDFNNMYMTSFIQLIIDNVIDVKAVQVNGNWCEFDTIKDLSISF